MADGPEQPGQGDQAGQSGRPRFWTRRSFLTALGVAGGAGAVVGGLEVFGLYRDAEDHKQEFTPPRASDFHLQGLAAGPGASAAARRTPTAQATSRRHRSATATT